MRDSPDNPTSGPGHESGLVTRLRAGDKAAFRDLVTGMQGSLVRLARSYSRNESVIEEAVQETWLAVIRGISRFEERSTLRTWIFSILVNHARRLAVRAQKQFRLEMGPAADGAGGKDEPVPGMGANGMWDVPPTPWGLENPEAVLIRREALAVVEAAIEEMPEAQRLVLTLRDIEGLGAEEVCNILDVSGTNVRVLLHRGRARVRAALDAYFRSPSTPGEPPERIET